MVPAVAVSGSNVQCTNPVRLLPRRNQFGRYNLHPDQYPDGLLVPCGRCLACRISKRREWSLRMLHELADYDDAMFLTLTYNDDNLPPNGSLVKADLQKFFKRLRKRLDADGRKIRYFACGEYGEQTQRPHYHAIIFGLSLRDEDKQLVMDSWDKMSWHVPQIRKQAFGMVEPDSIAYVAQYIDKKYTGDLARTEYEEKNREPVFKVSSLGIGKKFCDENADQLKANLYTTVKGVRHSLPRYYVERLGLPREVLQAHAAEADMEVVEHHIGISGLTRDEAYHALTTADVRSLESGIAQSKAQHDVTIQKKCDLYKKKI